MIEISEPTLRLLEVAGSWVSGIGALLAVWVSLRLSRNVTAVKLAVRAGHRIVVTPGDPATPEFISIGVVNLGQSPVIVTTVGWRWGPPFRRRYAMQMLHGVQISHVPPVTLTTGQQASFMVPLEGTGWMERMAGDLDETWPWLSAWLMRVQISTSVGKTVTKHLEKGLRQKLVAARKTLNSKAKS